MSWKDAFSLTLARADAPLHFAAHSHHPWPDVTFEAQKRYWRDAAAFLDGKWAGPVEEVRARLKGRIARILNLPDPQTLVFAPNTHDFIRRLLSCLPADRPARLLTTDSEFYSFARQTARLEEDGLVRATRIAQEPFANFADRIASAAADAARGGAPYDLIFFSQTFFNSGRRIADLEAFVRAIDRPETFVVIDGYHGFLATPTDLSPIADRAFYIAGGYKYAMAGEGACFMYCPPGYGARPRDTGWFAAFSSLSGAQAGVPFPETGERFAGATYDPSGLYRLDAVLGWMERDGPDIAQAHDHCAALQQRFADELERGGAGALARDQLLADPACDDIGRFLTFQTSLAGKIHKTLDARRVIVDRRGDRLRIGFGVYHEPPDIDLLLDHLREIG